MYQNVAVNLFPFEDYLYAGLVATYAPTMGATKEYLTGSHIWKTGDGINWQKVTDDGFGDDYVVGFEAFTTFNNTLYVAGSKGASSSTEGLGGAKIFRLAPTCPVVVTLKDDPEAINLVRTFRNEQLQNTVEGKNYINAYYEHAPELSRMLVSNEALRAKTKKMLLRLLPEIPLLLNGREITIPDSLSGEVASLLDEIGTKASPKLKTALKKIRKDTTSRKIFVANGPTIRE
jgi:hypothetical protein